MPIGPADERQQALLLIGTYLFLVMSVLDWMVYLETQWPRFLILLGYFFVAKLLGDIVYYRLRPGYRDFVNALDYLYNDFLPFARFAFPLAVIQRLVETSALSWYFGPRSVPLQLVAGPYLAIVMYLYNRFLRELAWDDSFHAGQNLTRLP
jgi:hypothetical protein